MLVVLSPAKKIEIKEINYSIKTTEPRFLNSSVIINNRLKELNPDELISTMSISKNICDEVFKYIHTWSSTLDKESFPCIFGFNGEAFRGLDICNYSKEDLEYANNHLRILSGLYGSLRPLDKIKRYRLEMGTKININNYNNLYSFWDYSINESLRDDVLKTESNIIVNLASKEYGKAAKFNELEDITVITPVFKEYKNGKYKVVTVHAKRARGIMASYIIKNKINNIEELKKFNEEGYKFREDLSEKDELIFTLD